MDRLEHCRLSVHQAEDPLGRRHRALQQVVFLGQVLQRLEEAPGELDERGQNSDRQSLVQHAKAAVPEQRAERHRAEKFHRRKEQRVNGNRSQVRGEVILVDDRELPRGDLFPAEQLHHPHSREMLLQEAVDACDPDSDVMERLPHAAAENCGDQQHDRDDPEGYQSETPVHHQHHRHDGDEGEHVAEHGHDSGGEQLVERLDVGGDPGHQPADRVPVEIGNAEALEVGKQLEPEIAHHPLADPRGEQRLTVVQCKLEEQGKHKCPRERAQQCHIVMGDGDIERPLGQGRADQGEHGPGQQHQHSHERATAIGPEIVQQPPHQRRVVAAFLGLFELFRCCGHGAV